jgi:Ni/Co efflux regulator RcnB
MKKILSAALAVSMLAGVGAAHADHDNRDRRDRHESRHDDDRRERYEDRSDKSAKKALKAERKAYKAYIKAQRRYQAARYQRPAGYRDRQWRHGEHLPVAYRTRAYNVDYNRYGLAPPPPGYQYTRVGNDVAMTSTTNGLIAQIILGLFR